MTAQIHQLACSPGGVPKRPIPDGLLHAGGLGNDWQTDREHHGGPDRAVCLFPLELITSLQAEGHPITPGAIGENITTSGLDWEQVVPGVQLQLGDSALLEIVSYAAPCKTIKAAFKDGNFSRVSQKTHPGSARAYARVVREGTVRTGDAITLIQPA